MPLAKEGNMQNPYDQYIKNQGVKPSRQKKQKPQKQQRRKAPGQKKKSKEPLFSWTLLVGSFAGLAFSFYIFAYTDEFMSLLDNIEIGVSTSKAADEEKKSLSEGKKDSEKEALPVGKVTQPKASDDHLTMKSTNVYKALKDKRRELEKKERRLAQLEEELQIQKVEIEKQLKEMQEMRRNISSKLDKKVAADQESVDKLVGVYSNMKPKNAALILSSVDDNLAVQILGKMKKQSAAAILDHVDPRKAQYLSEKFTGLKK
jgi:flagellar motility protein MotE (MotC chaperone)